MSEKTVFSTDNYARKINGHENHPLNFLFLKMYWLCCYIDSFFILSEWIFI